ncbi:hypothetical protein FRX31_028322 [Thalictrum thalictroides]|uniref:Uncharacterized protein n=1 Tax=Thalictrum thalictroides TaxID=46969 RepID=A0A7J6VCL2_THATH|nr:hypothetical protein FRX31_028322 [Thalictrum thalictroides]
MFYWIIYYAFLHRVFRIYYTKFWNKLLTLNPSTGVIHGHDLINEIKEVISSYKILKEKTKANSPSAFSFISQKIQMTKGTFTKDDIISTYMEEMKKDLLNNFSEKKSDISMTSLEAENMYASLADEAQNPDDDIITEEEIDEIFDKMKKSWQENIKTTPKN